MPGGWLVRPGWQGVMSRVLAAAVLWSVLGVLFALPGYAGPHWRMMLLGSLAQWWSWGLISPLIYAVDARLPVKERQLGLRVLAQLVPSLVITLAYLYVFAAMRALMGVGSWSALGGTALLVSAFHGGMLWSWLVYWLILGARQTLRYYEHYMASELRLERMERNFSEARLNALRMQLDPHFLFNALNTISAQVEREPRLARTMIEHLGDLLRLSLEARERQELPLHEEMAFLEHYLSIQKIRFGAGLRVETHIEPEVKYALVPCLMVQPLVENAIRHGISRRASGGEVVVTAQRMEDRVVIRVMDDGVGLPAGWTLAESIHEARGLGLSVTRERILGLHPNGEGRFTVRRRKGGGTEAEVTLPFRLAGGVESDERAGL
jgi:two-component system LytT family sensor kinase